MAQTAYTIVSGDRIPHLKTSKKTQTAPNYGQKPQIAVIIWKPHTAFNYRQIPQTAPKNGQKPQTAAKNG